MGKRGKKGGRGRGGFARGGNGANNTWRERTNKNDVDRHNSRFEAYYHGLQIVSEDEEQKLWEAMRRDLPNSFRFTGSKGHALAVQQRLKDFYIPEITSITYDGEVVEAPKPVNWYPDQLAWYMTTPKHIIRRFPPFASFQKFLVAETDVGNISRQEVVSMIPPLCMDIQPGMTVLDLCAAPGSKSAQLIEMVHGGEEYRSQTVAKHIANGLDRPDGVEFEDEGRSTGLLIANDVDYRRAHMLVHQMKRLSSPNIIVTNHDATVYPSIKLPSILSSDGKPLQNRYLKFDRILADVPCSGDGTCRKNLEIWKNWNPANALGLHPTQVRILVRALQMLKVGGRVIYSTCSMNPVEDEAVLATAIDRCGGSGKVEIVDSGDYLPELKRCAGKKTWNIMDKQGRIWANYEDVVRQRKEEGIDALGRLQESMFPPKHDYNLERCMRVYPHLQDTGAFFIAILEKKSEIKAKTEEKSKIAHESPVRVETANETGEMMKVEVKGAESTPAPSLDNALPTMDQSDNGVAIKRKREDSDARDASAKRSKSSETRNDEADPSMAGEEAAESSGVRLDVDLLDKLEDSVNESIPVEYRQAPSSSLGATEPDKIVDHVAISDRYKTKKSGQTFEEPFKYLDADLEELKGIRKFYDISPRFPPDRFMVRNATGIATKNIYYTTALAKSILQENEGKGMKFVHCGVKMFVKQDVPKPDICPWRIQTDGLAILEPWVGPQRRIRLWKRETLRKLLIEMFPRFNGDEWKNLGEIGDQIKEVGMGCCVLQIEPSEAQDGLRERMIFPLWKSLHSLNLMLPKEDRKALLLRLFNDDTPLVNLSQKHANGDAAKVEIKAEFGIEQEEAEQRRNSSSGEEDDGGGVPVNGIESERPAGTMAEDVQAEPGIP